jgi:tetratricopeptide (TPR) repeat protein
MTAMRPTITPAPADVIAALRRAVPHDPDGAYRAGLLAMRADRDEEALPLLRRASTHHVRDARVWQVLGLTARNIGDLAQAVDALERARGLAPTDGLIAHGAARARLEAGLPAVDDFVHARRLSKVDGSLIQGLAAARFADGDVAGAIAEIETVVRTQPLWLDGHATLSRLRRMAGDADDLRSYREAIERQARPDPTLWLAWISTLLLAERFEDMARVIDAARRVVGNLPVFDLHAAIAADETGAHEVSGAFFDRLPDDIDASTVVRRVRSMIRRGRIDEAGALAHRGTTRAGGRILWPYVALCWRMRDDPRWAWLEGDPSFVQVHDMERDAGDVESLAARLRSLHIAKDQPLDQSVRKGTQTDGPLLARIEPEIARLRHAIRAAIERYVAALPPPDPAHPLLAPPRGRVRFAGSWSVRLTDGGHHADHVHSHGWISSAFYVALPTAAPVQARDGWLTLGASDKLVPGLAPFREIEPRTGRLVLFPSTMWHGTRAFARGERLTVAFDVAQSR